MTLALFDLDETLIAIDSAHQWANFIMTKGLVKESDYRYPNQQFFSDNKKIIKQQLDMIEYLIADNKRLRNKLDKIYHRQGLQFRGTQQLTKNKKK
mgnify:CR=1 FL=1